MDGRKIIQLFLGGLVIIAVIGYSFFVIDDFVRGPKIIIDTPKSGFSTTTPILMVSGRGIHTNNLSINGSQTPVDLKGNFQSQLILAPGYNIIKVTAKDNYDRTVEKTIEIVLVVPEKELAQQTISAVNSSTTAESIEQIINTQDYQATKTINQY